MLLFNFRRSGDLYVFFFGLHMSREGGGGGGMKTSKM